MRSLRKSWMMWMPVILLSFALGCGEPKNEPIASTQDIQTEIQTASTPTAPPALEEDPVENQESELASEDIASQAVQTAVADITLDEYLQTVSLRHNKPLFVNFWATWCAPCVEEMPRIVELHQKYGQKVDFLAVSCDGFTGTTDTVPAAMKKLQMAFTTRVLKTDDQNQAISAIDSTWRGAIPATFVYDVKGEKIKSFFGAQSQETFENAIQEALKTVLQVSLD
ncbi:MAG: TlpA family protein disulfide reductase [Candidatus Hinthialibacter sp.]